MLWNPEPGTRKPQTALPTLTKPKKGTNVPKMGTTQPRTSQFGAALFTETQQRVLGHLFGQSERSFYTKELIKRTGAGSGAVQRELKRLEESGLVTAHWQGNQKHYQANPDAPIFEELRSIARKTFALADPVLNCLQEIPEKIDVAFIYGSVAKQSEHAASDVDLLVVSDEVTYGQLIGALQAAESQLDRRINPTLYSPEDIRQRLSEGNSFLTRILDQPLIWLIGNKNELRT